MLAQKNDSALDFALIRLASLPNTQVYFLGWDPTDNVVTGTALAAISHPRNLPKTLSYSIAGTNQANWIDLAASQGASIMVHPVPLYLIKMI
jgi:hypothetical protein